jgi:glycosyltransferase involved in cell wall biosynthesis
MQNVEIIAEVAKMSVNDNIHYYIIGGGASRNRIASLVEGLSNVTLLPMQPSEFAESIYAQADVNVIPLSKGGIKTALPSKTATVLRTDSYAVFCIDKASKFEDAVKISDNVRVAYNDDANSLYQVIKSLEPLKSIRPDDNGKIMELFSVKNAYKYVDIFEEATAKTK